MHQTIQSYHIFLDDPQEVYHAKDIISGHIHLEISKPLRFQSIKVRIHGRAKTRIQYGTQNDVKYAHCKRNIIDSIITTNTEGTRKFKFYNLISNQFYEINERFINMLNFNF